MLNFLYFKIDLKGTKKSSIGFGGSQNLENRLEEIKQHLVKRGTFVSSKSSFIISMEDIPPLILIKQQKQELCTQTEKKSVDLKEN